MRRVNAELIVVACVGLAVAGCVGPRPLTRMPPCDLVTGSATNIGRVGTIRRAEIEFRSQLPDSRGDLIGAGYRQIKVLAKRSECRPYRLFGQPTSLLTCTVSGRVCGR